MNSTIRAELIVIWILFTSCQYSLCAERGSSNHRRFRAAPRLSYNGIIGERPKRLFSWENGLFPRNVADANPTFCIKWHGFDENCLRPDL